MARVETFEYKLAGMRKPDRFIVYASKGKDGSLLVQGSRTIIRLDPKTCKAIINWRGSHAKYFPHLLREMGAEPIMLPKEFVTLCVEFHPSSGDLIGTSPETGPVYVA